MAPSTLCRDIGSEAGMLKRKGYSGESLAYLCDPLVRLPYHEMESAKSVKEGRCFEGHGGMSCAHRSRMRPSHRSLRGALSASPFPERNRARELLELKGGEFLRIEASPHDVRTFAVVEIGIHLGEVLGDEVVPDSHLVPLFRFLEPSFQGQETSRVPAGLEKGRS